MSDWKSVIVLDDLAPEAVARLPARARRRGRRGRREAEASPRARYQALVVAPGTPVTAAVLAAAADLRVVGTRGRGRDGIDVAEATRRGVLVVHAPDAGAHLSGRARAGPACWRCARDLGGADAALRGGGAGRGRPAKGWRSAARTLGLVGLRAASAARRARSRAGHGRTRL